MAKAKKVTKAASSRPITDFFTRSSPASSQPPSSPLKPSQPTRKRESRAQRPSQATLDSSPEPSHDIRKNIGQAKSTMPRRAAEPDAPPKPITRAKSTINSTRTQGRQKDSNASTSNVSDTLPGGSRLHASSPPSIAGSSRKRKETPEGLDKETVSSNASSASSSSYKRIRISEVVLPSDDDIVMGSQSGEEEAFPSPRPSNMSSFYSQKDSIPTANTNSSSNSELNSLFDETSYDSSLFVPSASHEMSPPPADDVALDEGSPKSMTSADKTAQIVADIKARAYADVHSSPASDVMPDFKEDLDSSDEDEDELRILPLRSLNKGKGKSVEAAPSPDDEESAKKPQRYNLRGRGTTSSPSDARADISASYRSSSASKVPQASTSRRKSSANPLDGLLREKRLADRRGKGSDAFQLAEEAVSGKSLMQEEMDEEDEEAEDWADEEAARNAILRTRKSMTRSSSPGGDRSTHDDVTLDEDDQKRLLGEEQSEAVLAILEKDRQSKDDSEEERLFGIHLWSTSEHDDGMDMDVDVPAPPSTQATHPVIRLFYSVLEHQNVSQATLLLNSGVMATLSLPNTSFDDYLLDLALRPRYNALSTAAFHLLTKIWTSRGRADHFLTCSQIISILLRVGAQNQYLGSYGLNGTHEDPSSVDSIRRSDVLLRLLVLISTCANASRLHRHEVPDIILLLLLLSIDRTTATRLRNNIVGCINDMCAFAADLDQIDTTMESNVCNRILAAITPLEAPYRYHVIQLLWEGGHNRAARIARWVAYCIVTGMSEVSSNQYSKLPPIESVLRELTLHHHGLFKTNADSVDYINMDSYVQMLSVALSDVEGYAQEELANTATTKATVNILSRPSSPTKGLAEPQTPLQLVRVAIEKIHSSITDTRIVQLDRSRVKASLKMLSMRIVYQRSSAISRLAPRKNLLGYLKLK